MKRLRIFPLFLLLVLPLQAGTLDMDDALVAPNVVVSGTGDYTDPDATLTTPGTSVNGIDHDGVGALVTTVPEVGNFISTMSLLWTGKHILTAAHSVTDDGGAINFSSGNLYFQLSGITYVIGVSPGQVRLHPDWDGDLLNGHDLAVIELDAVVDVAIPRYDIYTGSTVSLVGADTTFFGYGNGGVGATGSESLTAGDKRYGENVIDGVPIVEDVLEESILLYDFDNGLEAQSSTGDLGLGDEEALTAPGDSGGPMFVEDADMAGRFLIAGVHSFGASLAPFDIDTELNNSFGELSGNANVSFDQDWITSVVPEPATGSLLWAGALALLARRYRR